MPISLSAKEPVPIPHILDAGIWKGVAEWFGVEPENMIDVLPNMGSFDLTKFDKDDLYAF